MKKFLLQLVGVSLSFLAMSAQAFFLGLDRYSVSDLVSIHRDQAGEYFSVESYKIINKPANSSYSASVSLRDMKSSHMFDLILKGQGAGGLNIEVELRHSFTRKCVLVIHDSIEIHQPELFIDTSRCDQRFHVSPILGHGGYYFLRIGYHD